MQGPKAEGGDDVVSDINITPLCDILVVLLIIFMITAQAASLQGPKVASLTDDKLPSELKERTSVGVTIGADNTISLDVGLPEPVMVTELDLLETLRKELAKTTKRIAVIRAHPTLTLEQVMKVVGMAEKCDAQISIGTKTRF